MCLFDQRGCLQMSDLDNKTLTVKKILWVYEIEGIFKAEFTRPTSWWFRFWIKFFFGGKWVKL